MGLDIDDNVFLLSDVGYQYKNNVINYDYIGLKLIHFDHFYHS